MRLIWNGIVKDEAAILDRCIDSLLPHIDGAVILDTGSTDGTPELLERRFDQAGKPLEIHHGPFLNFSHARNLALAAARASPQPWDWVLLCDADMQLVVEQPFKLNGGLSYDIKQKAGALEYYNRRLVSREATGGFVGVTHEFLDIATAGICKNAYFIDYADGANRPDKILRDIALLEEALKTETKPGIIERYRFYLGQSFFDLGDWAKAAENYKIRTELGGFEEEKWYAQLQYARCRAAMGVFSDAVWQMLRAYNMRPQSAESLYELGRLFRERGDNHASLLFSEAGLSVPYPKQDSLFINNWVCEGRIEREFAICAYYDERRRSRGAKECNKLALAGSEQARGNLYWYLQPLGVQVPSRYFKAIDFKAPEGYAACNPSVINKDGQLVMLVRTVNYKINEEGGYDIRDGDGACSDHNPIHTRNFLVHSQSTVELSLPEQEPQYLSVRGFEDSRLFMWNDELWTLSTVREWNKEGWCEQVLAALAMTDRHSYTSCQKLLPKERRHEKNWMPWVRNGELCFVYRLGTLVSDSGEFIARHDCGLDVSRISGGSQVVQLDERTWIALVHEACSIPGRYNRYYQHRFVSFWPDGRVDRISAPFFFHDRQIEFAAGLAVFGKQLMCSYGVMDREARTARNGCRGGAGSSTRTHYDRRFSFV
jgi:glycosyltransferase involved in cell wall biosynthesis